MARAPLSRVRYVLPVTTFAASVWSAKSSFESIQRMFGPRELPDGRVFNSQVCSTVLRTALKSGFGIFDGQGPSWAVSACREYRG